MSLGFFLDESNPVIWRGAMVARALQQLLRDTEWGILDYLIIDLPPGTGDVQLTLVQSVAIKGVVIVTTPQEVALIDARKGVMMFQKTGVRILGIIENMSYFVCPHCHQKANIFDENGGRREAQRLGVLFLGEIPIDTLIRQSGDRGIPVVVEEPESAIAKAFLDAARAILKQCEDA